MVARAAAAAAVVVDIEAALDAAEAEAADDGARMAAP